MDVRVPFGLCTQPNRLLVCKDIYAKVYENITQEVFGTIGSTLLLPRASHPARNARSQLQASELYEFTALRGVSNSGSLFQRQVDIQNRYCNAASHGHTSVVVSICRRF